MLEIRLEIIPDTFVEEKKTFFKIINQNFSTPKNPIFPKGLTYGLGKKKFNFFLFLLLVKIRLETGFNNALHREKKRFFDRKNKNF